MRTLTREININGETFELTMNFRSQKSFSLTIREPYKLRLNLPFLQGERAGLRFIEERKDWITKKNNEIIAKKESSYLYQGGEEIWFLGKRFQFLVMNGEEHIVVSGDTICFYTHKRTKETILSAFYEASLPYLRSVCNEYEEDLLAFLRSKAYYRIPRIEFKIYKRRWGVCYPTKNLIVLNPYLIHFLLKCIYYVYLHEMVHFLYPNHSRDFYRTVSEKLPDYKSVVSMMH